MAMTITIDLDTVVTVINVDAASEAALKDCLANPDQELASFINDRWIPSCKNNSVKRAMQNLREAGVVAPADDDTLITTYATQPGYKNAKTKAAEAV